MTREQRSKHRLHLLEIGLRWPPETFLCWKLEGLAARGMQVTVASRSIELANAKLDGVDLVALPGPGAARPRAIAIWLTALRFLLRSPRRFAALMHGIMRLPQAYRRRYGGATGLLSLYLPVATLRPDVVHFEWNHTAALYLPMFGVWGCPVVTSCHGSEVTVDRHVPGQQGYAELLPVLLQASSAVHCVSESLRQLVLELGVEPLRSHVIRQGVDTTLFSPADGARRPADGPLRVIAVGWARWIKGFEWALEAIRLLVDSGVPAQLEILGVNPTRDLGDRTEQARLRHTVADLGLQQHVRLREEFSTADVAGRLRDSDVLLLPSLEEGLPTVVLEAMACGLAVVATDCGGVSEAVTHGVEGLLVRPRDSAAMAHSLERLWRDPALRARIGEAGRQTATSRFTLERQLDDFEALYSEVTHA